MKPSLDASLRKISVVFESEHDSVLGNSGIFTVPEYQREYSWKAEDECERLWEDIENAAFAKDTETYFLGSIIINCVTVDEKETHCFILLMDNSV